ncbi:hypothetical protein JTB14_001673 [Gonioctena quinquepunctata]|nr:hypothetical protein JTB14_001673 [Gonioctena quinquepunctata]
MWVVEVLLGQIYSHQEHNILSEAGRNPRLRPFVQLFLAALYSSKADETSLDQIRYEIFSKSLTKPNFELASLPPTNAATAQLILRVYLQIQGWYDRPNYTLSWGWRITDLGLLLIINTKDPAPPEILKGVYREVQLP